MKSLLLKHWDRLRSSFWFMPAVTASLLLGTVAGSMIAIVGTVFSMTLVALSLASSQLGPRLLRNFMRDTANQVVLGTFVATFVYCLLMLRTIRRADALAFVPHLSVLSDETRCTPLVGHNPEAHLSGWTRLFHAEHGRRTIDAMCLACPPRCLA